MNDMKTVIEAIRDCLTETAWIETLFIPTIENTGPVEYGHESTGR